MSKPDIRSHLERQARASRSRKAKAPASSAARQHRSVSSVPPSTTGKRILAFLDRIPWVSILFGLLMLLSIVILTRSVSERQQLEQDLLAQREQQEQKLLKEQEERESRIQAEPETCEIRYLIPNQDDIIEVVPYGTTVSLHSAVELDGYTFIGWDDPDGLQETRSSFPLYHDIYYTAHYALPLETQEHIPYLQADKDGVVNVDAWVSMREFVKVLYRLLNIDLVGQGTFLDVPKDDSCYKAAATLKDLGILEGNELYPDDWLRFGEMLRLLGRFYPPANEGSDFSALSDDPETRAIYDTAAAYGWIEADAPPDPAAMVTRGALAHLMNRVLGRSLQYQPRPDQVGMILDVSPSHPYYMDIAEAVIPHEYILQDDAEIWTDSDPLPVHEPGLFFAGVRLHYIKEDGTPALNITIDGRTFNGNGELTTGDADLDWELWDILEEQVDPSSMEQEEMLRILYDYVCDNFSLCSDTLYEIGAEGWAIPEAWRILNNDEASSYGHAALFYELAYMIGCHPTLISGCIYGTQTEFQAEDGTRVEAPEGRTPHAWVEIPEQGISYIYDPAGESRVDTYRQLFKRNEPIRWQRGYQSVVY